MMARSKPRLWPGQPYPLGATWDGAGVNFALFSEHATRVELGLFDTPESALARERLELRERTDLVWHGYVPGLGPGQLYGYRVHGPYEPQQGLRFNPAKLLIDPYARALAGPLRWSDELFGYRVGDPAADLSRDDRDSAGAVPKAVVIDPAFDWEGDHPPRVSWHRSILYEVHVKGFSAQHPGVPAELRGTYAGLATPAAVDYLTALGITAVELLPVHHHVEEHGLVRRGLTNYWGYNSIGFFAPDARYSSSGCRGEQVREFKAMVKALHRAGIEVLLDVVYNHTAEGNHLGPTLGFRGIDNAAYYRLVPGEPRYYRDYTGCGNTLNVNHPRTLQLLMDSLRYWVLEMHADGFRFDLAPTLARENHAVDRLSAFFDVIHQDPVISRVKLIADPWDLGEGGYQVGNFPVGWAEWNGRYRDAIRRYWRGDPGQVADLAYRLTGSSDLYQDDGRRPCASVNFVTAHDGFTLADLVSYNAKRNEANGEGNRDGSDDNLSWNCGVEGPTDDPTVLTLRERQMRNFLATLLLSQGIPMLCGGDEIGRTQHGNNNAYCQDNPISWFDWNLDDGARRLLTFTRRLIRLRHEHPELRRRKFFQGRPLCDAAMKDILWIRPDGGAMAEAEWRASTLRAFGFRLCGEAMDDVDEQGEPITDDTLLILLNAHPAGVRFVLPDAHPGVGWEVLVDTAVSGDPGPRELHEVGASISLAGSALQLLRAQIRGVPPAPPPPPRPARTGPALNVSPALPDDSKRETTRFGPDTVMPANLTPEYKAAEAAFRKARDPRERLEWLREMLRVIPKHKGTDHLQGDIKRRIKELSEELERPKKGGARGGPALVIRPEGAAQIALIGPPNAGKSSLHARLTGSGAQVAPYPFTTQYPEPGMMPHEDTCFQLIDLPAVSPDHPVPWLASTLQTADACLLVVDLADPACVEQVEAGARRPEREAGESGWRI